MENNKVNVKIYGQEYIIAGELPKEEIIHCASIVDAKMQEIAEAAKSAGASPQNVAILAAVNIVSEGGQLQKKLDEFRSMNIQLEKDAQHYVQLWDESKKAYSEYKEETQAIVHKKEELLNQLGAKDAEIARLKQASEEAKNQIQSRMNDVIIEMEGKCWELENSFRGLQNQLEEKDAEIARLKQASEEAKNQIQSGMNDVISEMEGKCRELENSFFDLQMENLQLKKELDRYKSSTGEF